MYINKIRNWERQLGQLCIIEIDSKSIGELVWDTSIENKRAQHIYETKIGAKKFGIRENAYKDQVGNWRTAVDYEVTREEFFSLERNELLNIRVY